MWQRTLTPADLAELLKKALVEGKNLPEEEFSSAEILFRAMCIEFAQVLGAYCGGKVVDCDEHGNVVVQGDGPLQVTEGIWRHAGQSDGRNLPDRSRMVHPLADDDRVQFFPLLHSGKNPSNYLANVARTGDTGIYEEVRVGIYHPLQGCVSDVFVGLTEQGEPRILLTTDGDGDGDHKIAVYPLKAKDQAVELNFQ